MNRSGYSRPDAIGGGVTFLIGLGALLTSLNYRMGTIASIGPGVFPAILGGVLMLIGLAIFLGSMRVGAVSGQRSSARPNLRAVLGVAGALVTFAFMMRWFGLVPAILGCVLVSRLSEPKPGLLQPLVLAVGLAVSSWLIFVVGLNLPLPVLRIP